MHILAQGNEKGREGEQRKLPSGSLQFASGRRELSELTPSRA